MVFLGGRGREGVGDGEVGVVKGAVMRTGKGRLTLEARAEGSLAVPKCSVARFRSTSLTFW